MGEDNDTLDLTAFDDSITDDSVCTFLDSDYDEDKEEE